MKLKGTMVIELTDMNTGDAETITEENMVTNVVNHLLGITTEGKADALAALETEKDKSPSKKWKSDDGTLSGFCGL